MPRHCCTLHCSVRKCGMGLWETGLPRRDGRTPWANQLSYQPVSRANSQGWPAGMAARMCRICSGVQ